MDIEKWREDVSTHNHAMEVMVNDRFTLKKTIITHLKQYFDFDDISFENDFSVITLKWDYSKGLVINPSDLIGLNMEFTVSHEFSDELGDGVIVQLYPFGFEELED